MTTPHLHAALFDLDGVVFDTESQYTVFWGSLCKLYRPDRPGLEQEIKGRTLVEIFSRYFSDFKDEQPKIVERLNSFERNMRFEYINGLVGFVEDLRRNSVKTAIVTSSNRMKMSAVYSAHPELKSLFDKILTSEDFKEGKPSPDCYLTGAAAFGLKPEECVVFEDSFNGLKAGRNAGMKVVGLATTNSEAAISPYSDLVVKDFSGLTYEKTNALLSRSV